MNATEINIAIAEACGWKFGMHQWSEEYWMRPDGVADSIPNYHDDLNACAEMWEFLGWEEKNECIEHLKEIVKEADCQVYFATAPQRCEAFLRTIGKWVDDEATSDQPSRETPAITKTNTTPSAKE